MTSPTPLEKVAMAIAENMIGVEPDDCWYAACAAINALKDPDEGTVEAMTKNWREGNGWTIGEALGETFNAALDHIIQAGEKA